MDGIFFNRWRDGRVGFGSDGGSGAGADHDTSGGRGEGVELNIGERRYRFYFDGPNRMFGEGRYRSVGGSLGFNIGGRPTTFDVRNPVRIEQYRLPDLFIAVGNQQGGQNRIFTKNLVPGSVVLGEEVRSILTCGQIEEYREWSPYQSKLGGAITQGVDRIHIRSGNRVLYLGAQCGYTVSHVSDIVGPRGKVYAVEFSDVSSSYLLNIAEKRRNIIPIIDDPRNPLRYRMLVGKVDCIVADLELNDQIRILSLNAQHYLKDKGHFVIFLQGSQPGTPLPRASDISALRYEQLNPQQMLKLTHHKNDHIVTGIYKPRIHNVYMV